MVNNYRKNATRITKLQLLSKTGEAVYILSIKQNNEA